MEDLLARELIVERILGEQLMWRWVVGVACPCVSIDDKAHWHANAVDCTMTPRLSILPAMTSIHPSIWGLGRISGKHK